MDILANIIIPGFLLGGIYALVSVGLSLQYGVARVLNIAHGEFIMVGAFVTFWLFGAVNLNPLVSAVVTGPLVFVIGWILYSTIFRRLMDASPNVDIFEAKSVPPQTTRAKLRGEFIRRAQEKRRDFTVDWVHLKLNDQAQRTVLCKDPFRSVDERVERLIQSM